MGYDQIIEKQFFGIVEELLRIGEPYEYDYDDDTNGNYDYEAARLLSPENCDTANPSRLCYGCKFEAECLEQTEEMLS